MSSQYLIISAQAVPGADRADTEREAVALARRLDCVVEVRFGGDLVSARPDGIIPRQPGASFAPPKPCGDCGKKS